MPELVWTRQAVQDVEDIKSYIGRTSPRYAALVAERIVGLVERLREFPSSGRVVPEFNREDVREIIWGNYRVVYRIRTNSVHLLHRVPRSTASSIPDPPVESGLTAA